MISNRNQRLTKTMLLKRTFHSLRGNVVRSSMTSLFMTKDRCMKGSLMSMGGGGNFCALDVSQASPRHVDRHNEQKGFT